MAATAIALPLATSVGAAGCRYEASPRPQRAQQPSVYRPFHAGAGFSEAELRPGVWLVSFTGLPGTPVGQLVEHAKRRAAELALEHGLEYIRIVQAGPFDELDERVHPPRYREVWVTDATGFSRPIRVMTAPGHTETRVRPSVALVVELHAEQVEGALSAVAIADPPPGEEQDAPGLEESPQEGGD